MSYINYKFIGLFFKKFWTIAPHSNSCF